MLVQPRPPCGAHTVARLQNRFKPRAEPAAHQSKMAAMLTREQLGDRIRFAVPLDAKHNAFVGPLHRMDYLLPESAKITAELAVITRSFLGEIEPHRSIAFGILAPALAPLHEQEQVH